MAISKNDAVRHTGMALRDCQNRAEGSEKGLSAVVVQAYEQGGGRSKVT